MLLERLSVSIHILFVAPLIFHPPPQPHNHICRRRIVDRTNSDPDEEPDVYTPSETIHPSYLCLNAGAYVCRRCYCSICCTTTCKDEQHAEIEDYNAARGKKELLRDATRWTVDDAAKAKAAGDRAGDGNGAGAGAGAGASVEFGQDRTITVKDLLQDVQKVLTHLQSMKKQKQKEGETNPRLRVCCSWLFCRQEFVSPRSAAYKFHIAGQKHKYKPRSWYLRMKAIEDAKGKRGGGGRGRGKKGGGRGRGKKGGGGVRGRGKKRGATAANGGSAVPFSP